jgi:hypothetical protein
MQTFALVIVAYYYGNTLSMTTTPGYTKETCQSAVTQIHGIDKTTTYYVEAYCIVGPSK